MTEQEWLASTDPARMMRWVLRKTPLLGDLCPKIISSRKLRLFACACCRQPEVWDRLTDDAPCGRCSSRPPALRDAGDRECLDCSGTGRLHRSRRAVEVAERYADGLATEAELSATRQMLSDGSVVWWLCCPPSQVATEWVLRSEPSSILQPAIQASLIRCITGNPWQPVMLPKVKRCKKCSWDGTGPNRKYCDRPLTFDGKVPHLWTEYSPWLVWNDGAVAKLARIAYEQWDWSLLPLIADALEDAGCPSHETYQSDDGWGAIDRRPHPILAHLRGPGPHARGCHVLDALLGKE